MKAIIGGAGIAGLALAAQLGKAGWKVIVADAAPAPRDEAYMIDLFGSGYEAARRMGMLPRLLKDQYVFRGIRWLNGAGHSSAFLRREMLVSLLGGRLLSLLRGDLERAVLEELPPDVDVRFNCPIVQVRVPTGGVEVLLANGQTERADVLIGADGIHSRIRELVFGDSASWIRMLGLDTASLAIDAADLNSDLANELQILSVPGRQVAFHPLRSGKVAVSFLRRTSSRLVSKSAYQALSEAYGDLNWRVPLVLERARELTSLMYEEVGQVVMAHWCRGRVALLGDACQAVTLLPGQGASLSLAAACVLAEELCGPLPVKEALLQYEHRVRPELIRMRRAGRRAAEWVVPATAAGIMARNAAIRLSSRPGLARLLRPVMEVAKETVLPGPDPTPSEEHQDAG